MHEIVILYHDKKTEKICKDIKKAKQELPVHIPLKLCTRSKSTDQCSGINCLNGLDKYVSAEQLFVLLDYP